MEPVRAQVAVLSVAGSSSSVTIENIVADSLTAAGHQITSFESVKDTETAIRAQLVGWIEDPDIDLVLVIGDGAQTSKAMAPLVTQPLPGFADLLRMLAFQEIGASAMLSTAEAARCTSTFVFVLPSSEKAVGAAMEKLILPQLDPKTTPKNLISEMPRFKEEGGDFTRVDTPAEPARSPLESVPVAITKERTASGAGVVSRLPAKQPAANDAKTVVDKAPEAPTRSKPVTQQRVKSATGKNVVVRKVEDPTKPIELQKLERQIELSKVTGDKTKPMDLSRLPSLPPGADQTALEGPGEDTLPANVKPVPSIAKTVPARATPPAGKPVQAAQPLPRVKQPTPAQLPRVKQPTPALPLKPPPAAAVTPAPTSEPIAIAKPKPAPSLVVVEEHEQPPAARPRPKTAPPHPPPQPQLSTEEIEPLDPDELETIERSRASVEELSASAIVLEQPAGPLDRLLPAEPARARPPTPAPPPPPPPADEPKPRPRPASAKSTTAALVDLPLPATVELPAGTFDYQVKRSKAPLVIGLLVVVALAIGGVILFQGRGGGGDRARDAGTEVAQNDKPPAPDAAVIEPPPAADAADVIEMDPADAAVAEPPPASQKPPATEKPPANQKPPATEKPPATGQKPPTTGQKPPATGQKPPTTPPPTTPPVPAADPGCDEPTCVIEKYARPCCAKYKPTGEGFVPGGSENLEKPQIRAGIDRMRPAISRCGEKHPAKGTVKIAVSVTSEGTVDSVSVVTAPDDELGQCVAALVKKATFAKTTNGGSFTYPFVF